MKSLKAVFSEWTHFHSDCATIKAHPSKTLSRKPLTVISSDPTHEKSESQTYFHMQTAKQSIQGKFLLARGAGHDIPSDFPKLVIRAVEQMLEAFNNKTPAKLEEETLPQLKKQTRFFLDGELSTYVRNNTTGKKDHKKLKDFCQQLGFGFETYSDFGYFDDPKSGIQGYFVVCS